MEINRFVKRLFCVAIAVIMMFGASFSASATGIDFESTDISESGDDINIEDENTSVDFVEDDEAKEDTVMCYYDDKNNSLSYTTENKN